MEKFGLFDLIDKLTTPQPTNQVALAPNSTASETKEIKRQTAKQSASLFLLRHAELSRKIDGKTKK